MKESLKQGRTHLEDCRFSQAENARDRDKLAALNQQKNRLWSEIQELKGQLTVATSIPDRVVDHAAHAGIYAGTCFRL